MKNKALFAAAVAGILGAAGTARAMDMKMSAKDGGKMAKGSDLVNCFGVNGCSGKGKCGGPAGNSCAGTNSCKGQGWLPMPKDSCLAIEGGSLEPKMAMKK